MKTLIGDLVYYHEKRTDVSGPRRWIKEIGIVVDIEDYTFQPEWGDTCIVMLASNRVVAVPPRSEIIRYIVRV
jgi:hypothetical protein